MSSDCVGCGGDTNNNIKAATPSPHAKIKTGPPVLVSAPSTPSASATTPRITRKTVTTPSRLPPRPPVMTRAHTPRNPIVTPKNLNLDVRGFPPPTTPSSSSSSLSSSSSSSASVPDTEKVMQNLWAKHQEQTNALKTSMTNKLTNSLQQFQTAAAAPQQSFKNDIVNHMPFNNNNNSNNSNNNNVNGTNVNNNNNNNVNVDDIKKQNQATIQQARNQMEGLSETLRQKLQSAGFSLNNNNIGGGIGNENNAIGAMANLGRSGVAQDLGKSQEVLQTLNGVMRNFAQLGGEMDTVQGLFNIFGKQVKLFMANQDDSRYYSNIQHRGPLFNFMSNDTFKWYRQNEVGKLSRQAGLQMVWQGSAPDNGYVPTGLTGTTTNNNAKRFQLEFHHIIQDKLGRYYVCGTAWDPVNQRLAAAVGRFSADFILDPTFHKFTENSQEHGSLLTQLFPTESKSVQLCLSSDQLRLFVLATTIDADSHQLIVSVCALQTSNGQPDKTWGNDPDHGVTRLTLEDCQGSVAVKMAIHPQTNELLILMQSQHLSGFLQSSIVRLLNDGSYDSNFLVNLDLNPNPNQTWLAHDLCWDDNKNFYVVGTLIRHLPVGDVSVPFVRKYLYSGESDTSFGLPVEEIKDLIPINPINNDNNNNINNDKKSNNVLILKTIIPPPPPPLSSSSPESRPGMNQMINMLNLANTSYDQRSNNDMLIKPIAKSSILKTITISLPPNNNINNNNNNLSGLYLLDTLTETQVGTATRIQLDPQNKNILHILGTLYDSIQGEKGVSCLWQYDITNTGDKKLIVFTAADCYAVTLAQDFAISTTNNKCFIVGQAQYHPFKPDSSDGFLVTIDLSNGSITNKNRLPMGAEHFQTLKSISINNNNSSFVVTGFLQTGRTIYTRLGCIFKSL